MASTNAPVIAALGCSWRVLLAPGSSLGAHGSSWRLLAEICENHCFIERNLHFSLPNAILNVSHQGRKVGRSVPRRAESSSAKLLSHSRSDLRWSQVRAEPRRAGPSYSPRDTKKNETQKTRGAAKLGVSRKRKRISIPWRSLVGTNFHQNSCKESENELQDNEHESYLPCQS